MPKVMTIGSLSDCGCGLGRTRRRRRRRTVGKIKNPRRLHKGACPTGTRSVERKVKVCYKRKGSKKRVCRKQKVRECARK